MSPKIKFPKEILAQIKTHLEGEQKKLLSQIADLSAQDPFSDTDRLMDNAASDTEAKEEFNHERYQAMLEELKTRQSSIEGALKRVNKGTYGYCVKCGELIDTDRLGAMPTATLCISCEGKKK